MVNDKLLHQEQEKVISICHLLLSQLRKNPLSLEFHSSYKRTINFTIKKGQQEDFSPYAIISFLTNDLGMQASSLRLPEASFQKVKEAVSHVKKEDILFLILDQDQNLILSKHGQELKLGNLYVSYDASMPAFCNQEIENILGKKDIILSEIINCGKAEGIRELLLNELGFFGEKISPVYLNLTRGQNFIKEDFHDFCRQYKEEGKIISYERLIGYGSGLTPYMDDFLAGIMIGENALSQTKNNLSLLEKLANKTNKISFHLLNLAARGLVAEHIKNLLLSLAKEPTKANMQDIRQKIKKVLDFGHSSGTDTLCGIYLAILLSERGKL